MWDGGRRAFLCSQCPRARFRGYAPLLRHLRQHKGPAPFACLVCRAAFNRRDYLAAHMRSHKGDRPFRCPRCPAAFTTDFYLALHRRSNEH
ncbi:Escargot/snail protein homolog [Gryllus bimaculatus]|nr:Escargot/snail protein homolog [Gryllus bimaculatus]